MNDWLTDMEELVTRRAARLSRWPVVFQRLLFQLAIYEGQR